MNFDNVIRNAAKPAQEEPDDYIGDDGLLYCGKCHTKKQTRITLSDGSVIMPRCLCKCEEDRRERENEEFRRKERMIKIGQYRSAGFSDKQLRRCTFDADDGGNATVTRVARNYVKHFEEFSKSGQGLMFYGSVGTGKTFYASCIANALIDECIPCMVTNFSMIVNKLSGIWDGKQEFIESLNRYSLLVIDDFAMERNTEYVTEIVYNVIDSRYRSGKPLIVTTNLPLQQIRNPDSMDKQRIYSRINEMCYPVEVVGRDRRTRKDSSDVMMKLYE